MRKVKEKPRMSKGVVLISILPITFRKGLNY